MSLWCWGVGQRSYISMQLVSFIGHKPQFSLFQLWYLINCASQPHAYSNNCYFIWISSVLIFSMVQVMSQNLSPTMFFFLVGVNTIPMFYFMAKIYCQTSPWLVVYTYTSVSLQLSMTSTKESSAGRPRRPNWRCLLGTPWVEIWMDLL